MTYYKSASYEHGMARAMYQAQLTKGGNMKVNCRVLLSTLVCLSVAMAAPSAKAELLQTGSNELQRAQVRTLLVAGGVDATAAEARVAVLTDDETAILAQQFDVLPAGGNSGLAGLLGVAVVAYFVIKLLPFIVIGGGALAAIKASNRGA
jgi:hypothetical protein